MASSSLKPQTCGYLGPEGTYTEEAARRAAPDAQLVPMAYVERVFEAVASGEVDQGVVPVENLIQGPVTEALDCLYQHAGQIVLSGMVLLPIRHALGALRADETVSRIYSKDQALKQCSRYLYEHYPAATLHETTSTSAPMREIAEGRLPGAAVVGSADAMVRHGLQVLARNIGNALGNKTKFVVISPSDRRASPRTSADSTLFVVYPHRDRVGLLRTVVEVVSGRYGLNLSAIHSRPDALGAFRFFLEVEGHMSDPTLVACFDTLRGVFSGEQVEVVVVGSYPRTTFIEQRITDVAIFDAPGADSTWLVDLLSRCGRRVHRIKAKNEHDSARTTDLSDVQAVILHGPWHGNKQEFAELVSSMHSGQLLVAVSDDLEAAIDAMGSVADREIERLAMRHVQEHGGVSDRGCTLEFATIVGSGDLADEFEATLYKHGARIRYRGEAGSVTP